MDLRQSAEDGGSIPGRARRRLLHHGRSARMAAGSQREREDGGDGSRTVVESEYGGDGGRAVG